MKEEVCYLYWIREAHHTDIFSEGYVGITQNFDYRVYQHISNAKNPNQWKNYRTVFRKALISGDFMSTIVLVGSRNYCLEVEEKLRPEWKIGWNLARGGSGGFGTHGLTGQRSSKTYYNMLGRVRDSGLSLCEDWENDKNSNGLINFCKFYKDKKTPQNEMFLPKDGEVSPETVEFKTRAEFLADVHRVHDLYGDGTLRNLNELSDIVGVKPNTIATNLCRGFTLLQSCGLETKPERKVRLKNKDDNYRGVLTDEQIQELQVDYETGVPLLNLENKFNMSSSNLSRLVRRFGFTPPILGVVEGFDRNSFTLALHSKLKVEDYEVIKQLLLKGWPRYKIAAHLGVSGSTLTECCKKLKWGVK